MGGKVILSLVLSAKIAPVDFYFYFVVLVSARLEWAPLMTLNLHLSRFDEKITAFFLGGGQHPGTRIY